VRATRLAARIGDIAKYPNRREHEKQVALARRDMRWDDHLELLMFPEKAREIRASRVPGDNQTCTMCGDFCAMQRGSALFAKDLKGDKLTKPDMNS
jgi:phosphomethylpyrimidine synthase